MYKRQAHRAAVEVGGDDADGLPGLGGDALEHLVGYGEPLHLGVEHEFLNVGERNPHRTVSGGAPDYPVRQSTEGKDCLPGMLSTAPSCLGAIKGTPRRMQENTKHTLSILDHSHFVLAHSFDILSDLSFVLVRT